ncbi:DUF6266 family protein [Elizabethkingia meningoseptica]|uniref:DUF6266 family protein n=1 Tax=Elizabethkingia meningoseptica TaxID=238 RepID=UPI0038918776
MAILNSIILGRAKGSIGNVTLSTQKGRVIAKQKATIVSNPKTDEQMLQRNGLSIAVYLWQKLNVYIKEGITITSQYGNQYNAFVSENIQRLKNLEKDKEDIKSNDLQGMPISMGKYPDPFINLKSSDKDEAILLLDKKLLSSFAKVGDKVVLIYSDLYSLDFKMITFNVSLPMLTGNESLYTIPDIVFAKKEKISFAAYVITDNGKASSTGNIRISIP